MASYRELLLGAWRLVSFEVRRADGEVYFPMGQGLVGLLLYLPDGHMSVQLMSPDRPQFQTPAYGAGTDADWVVKLIDVYPGDYSDGESRPGGMPMGGFQQLLRGEPFPGRFRESFEKPRPFEPGQPAKIQFRMPDIYHTFRRGHRIMVQIQSTWFPLVDRNPQKYVANIFEARESDFEKATHRVWRSAPHPSSLRVLELR